MANQPCSTKSKEIDNYASGPTLGTLRIGPVNPFGFNPEEEAPIVLGEAYALLAFMSASYNTSQELHNTGDPDPSLSLLSQELKASALGAVARLISLSLHMLEAGEAARKMGGR